MRFVCSLSSEECPRHNELRLVNVRPTFTLNAFFVNERRSIRNGIMAMHPGLTSLSGRCPCRWLKPSYLASHEKTYLPLLPSRPDGVQQALVAQDPAINATCMGQSPQRQAAYWEFSSALAVCRYRAPLPPHLA